MDLPGKNIVLTGATGGIGSILAKFLSSNGAQLILLSRQPHPLTALASSLRCKYISCDLAKRSSRAAAIATIQASGVQVDMLINCAGIGIYKPLAGLTEQDWYSSYELNVFAPFFLTQKLAPKLTVNIGSCSAVHYLPERSLYNSTKAALRSLTLNLARELPGQFIHITLDSTLTEFGPLSKKEKQIQSVNGKVYLDPTWVANEIVNIISLDQPDSEYTLSPECYTQCGTWHKP